MRWLARRRFRWPLELVGLLALNTALIAYNARRDCRSPEFGIPMNCDPTWIGWVLTVALVAVVAGELVAAVRRRRPCPRCGRGVVKGRLDCSGCGFDFRTVGAR